MPTTGFHCVYILRDVATGQHHYTGVTQNLQERLIHHTSGHEGHNAIWENAPHPPHGNSVCKAFAWNSYLTTI